MQIKKKGLSPIIATTLLIVLVVILAAILWLWIRSFIGEKVLKEGQAIENLCKDVTFNVDVYSGDVVDIENTGNVPIYGVAIKKRGFASLKTIGTAEAESASIASGESVSGLPITGDVNAGENVIVLPMLMGLAKGDVKKYYTCDKEYGIEKEVMN